MKNHTRFLKTMNNYGIRLLQDINIFIYICELLDPLEPLKLKRLEKVTKMKHRYLKKVIHKLSDKPEANSSKGLELIQYVGSLGNVGKAIVLTAKGKRLKKRLEQLNEERL